MDVNSCITYRNGNCKYHIVICTQSFGRKIRYGKAETRTLRIFYSMFVQKKRIKM